MTNEVLASLDTQLFTVNDVCKLLKMSRRNFMSEFVLSGKLPFVVIRGQKKFMHADLKNLLNNSLVKINPDAVKFSHPSLKSFSSI